MKENFDVSVVLRSVKKTYRSQYRQLAEFIRRSSNVSWTESGRVVIDGVEMPDSNIVDLINDAARYRKTSAVPNGRAQLASAFRRADVPRKLIGNRHFWDDADVSSINLSDPDVSSSNPKDTSKPGPSTSLRALASKNINNNNNDNHRKTWLSWRPM